MVYHFVTLQKKIEKYTSSFLSKESKDQPPKLEVEG